MGNRTWMRLPASTCTRHYEVRLDADFHERDLTHKYGSVHASGISKYVVMGFALGAIVGGLAGFTKGCSEIRGIAEGLRAHGQLVCGTGFPIIFLGATVIGVLLGSLLGLLIGWAGGRRYAKRNPIRDPKEVRR
jgi:hypothetical protein